MTTMQSVLRTKKNRQFFPPVSAWIFEPNKPNSENNSCRLIRFVKVNNIFFKIAILTSEQDAVQKCIYDQKIIASKNLHVKSTFL